MFDYTTPITTTFELQRQTIEQGQEALARTVAFQQRLNEATLEGLDAQENAQRQAVQLQQDTFHTALDSVEGTVPDPTDTIEDVRVAVDEGYDTLLENHEEAFDSVRSDLEEGIETYDDLTSEYLEFVAEQVDGVVEVNEELESESVEVVEEVVSQADELQAHAEEMQEQAVTAMES